MKTIYKDIEIQKFLAWEQATHDCIDVKKIYIDIADDLIAGILLSQIVYWYLPSKKGDTKLRVEKQGELWLAKGRADWYEEVRISAKQFDRASKILVELGLIEKKLFKFNGNPTTHIKLNLKKLIEMVNTNLERTIESSETIANTDFTQKAKTVEPLEKPLLPKGENGYSPLGKMDIDQRGNSITEITTKNLSEILNQSVTPDSTTPTKQNQTDGQTEFTQKNIEEFEEILYESELSYVQDEGNRNSLEQALRLLYFNKKVLKIGNSYIPHQLIKKDLRKINMLVLTHTLNKFKKASEERSIKNTIAYLASCLYESIFSKNTDIDAEIRYSGI